MDSRRASTVQGIATANQWIPRRWLTVSRGRRGASEHAQADELRLPGLAKYQCARSDHAVALVPSTKHDGSPRCCYRRVTPRECLSEIDVAIPRTNPHSIAEGVLQSVYGVPQPTRTTGVKHLEESMRTNCSTHTRVTRMPQCCCANPGSLYPSVTKSVGMAGRKLGIRWPCTGGIRTVAASDPAPTHPEWRPST